MNPLELRDTVVEHLYNNWTSTDISWANKTYSPSAGTDWIKLIIINGFSRDLEIGRGGADLNACSVIIDIFTPVNSGNRQGLIYAEQIRSLFYDLDIRDVTFEAMEISELGENEGFYQVRCSFSTKVIYYPG